MGGVLKEIAAALILGLASLLCIAPASAGNVPSKRSAQKQAKQQQKVWKQYVKQRNKTQGKPPKQHYAKAGHGHH